jgi:SAM-dependent methyltransferase
VAKRRTSITIVCPRCTDGLLSPPLDEAMSGADGAMMACARCGASFPVADGVLDLLPGSEASRTLAQAAMEWEPLVAIYESRLWRRSPLFTLLTGISFDDEYDVIKTAASPGGARCILDLACGSGIYSRRLARECPKGTVVGLDLSLPMLRHAARYARTEHTENLRLVRGNALDLPFENDTFDVVNCCGALHLFPNLPRVLAEIERVLAPNGRFTAAVFKRQDSRFSERLNDLRRDLIGLTAFTADELAMLYGDAGLRPPQLYHDGRIWAVVASSKRSRSRARA